MSASWTSREVCEHVGVTYRQLDYWARTGLVTPSTPAAGQGTRRRFSAADVERVRRIAAAAAERRVTLAERV
jgi:DNA-binding transcriptional MerR regulator